jgi:hypothetical protein
MRKFFLPALLVLLCMNGPAQNLSYYLPTNVTYNPSIPAPKSMIGHEVGEFHVSHDRLVAYMKALAAANPGRILIEETGFTYENRPQLLLTISSPANIKRIESIRQQHALLVDPQRSAALNIADMPAVVWMGYSIHGNESSGVNASLLAAYYLAAAQGTAVDDLLEHTVILLDPSFNPDGMNRFASWVNTNRSMNVQVTDPASREFYEPWPGGRTNHYYFDLNRDWLPAQQPESRNRLKKFHEWNPNILTDHHEQGSNATFFFQPGVPSRVNPNTPKRNQELTGLIGNYHAKYLDSVGSLYFTKEGYDDFYYGKGSTYPDVNGSIGILFEQASSRGHAQETDNGLLTFPFTIRNQFITSLSTLEAARNLRMELLNYQREFFVNAQKEAAASPVKGYLFSDNNDKSKAAILLEMLLRHQIEILPVKKTVSAEGKNFEPGSSWMIPAQQRQFKLIKGIFEKMFKYQDSLFYDISSWTLPLAFNLPYTELPAIDATAFGDKLTIANKPAGEVKGGQSDYGYAFEWDDYFAPKLLYNLQKRGLSTKTATQIFESGGRKFSYGTILIPVRTQPAGAADVYKWISDAAKESGVTVYNLSSGLSRSGIDLGSNSFASLRQPKILLMSGNGTSGNDVGEIWYLLDQRFSIPVSMVEVERLPFTNFSRYNTIIMAAGSYSNMDKNTQEKLSAWVSAGGTLIASEEATQFLSRTGITKVIFKKDEAKKDTTTSLPWSNRQDEQRAKDMPGAIFEAKMDVTHPLCYGYRNNSISIFKSNSLYMDRNNGAYSAPVVFTSNPLQSGYLHPSNAGLVKNMAEVNVDALGSGRVISIADNLCFRALWLGTNKLFVNGIFFGSLVR